MEVSDVRQLARTYRSNRRRTSAVRLLFARKSRIILGTDRAGSAAQSVPRTAERLVRGIAGTVCGPPETGGGALWEGGRDELGDGGGELLAAGFPGIEHVTA